MLTALESLNGIDLNKEIMGNRLSLQQNDGLYEQFFVLEYGAFPFN